MPGTWLDTGNPVLDAESSLLLKCFPINDLTLVLQPSHEVGRAVIITSISQMRNSSHDLLKVKASKMET